MRIRLAATLAAQSKMKSNVESQSLPPMQGPQIAGPDVTYTLNIDSRSEDIGLITRPTNQSQPQAAGANAAAQEPSHAE